MNVAQLKAASRDLERAARATFPRLNERGSIEGVRPGPARIRPLKFPRLNERGSIEGHLERRPEEPGNLGFHV